MPISAKHVAVGRRTIEIPFDGDEVLHLTYDPNKIAVRDDPELVELRAQGHVGAARAYNLARVIVDWDVIADDGKPIKPTAETLEGFGMAVLVKLDEEIGADFLASMKNGSNSGNSSRQRAD